MEVKLLILFPFILHPSWPSCQNFSQSTILSFNMLIKESILLKIFLFSSSKSHLSPLRHRVLLSPFTIFSSFFFFIHFSLIIFHFLSSFFSRDFQRATSIPLHHVHIPHLSDRTWRTSSATHKPKLKKSIFFVIQKNVFEKRKSKGIPTRSAEISSTSSHSPRLLEILFEILTISSLKEHLLSS